MNKETQKYWILRFKKRRFRVLLDKVLLFNFIRRLRGRFWGIAAVAGLAVGFSICFIIRPDMLATSTAFSDFGNDVRTAPYFAGSVFFAAYGLWRWRNYLSHTWQRKMPVTGLVTLTFLGLYLVALMPISWKPYAYYAHIFGISLAGLSMLATVVIDGFLSRTKRRKSFIMWRVARVVSFFAIIAGGWLTFGSTEFMGWYQVSLIGETLLIGGYALWIIVRTYQGEGGRTVLSKFLKDFVLID